MGHKQEDLEISVWSQSHNLITLAGHGEQESYLRPGEKPSHSSAQKGHEGGPRELQTSSLSSIPGKVMEQLILSVISTHGKEKVTRSSQHASARGSHAPPAW